MQNHRLVGILKTFDCCDKLVDKVQQRSKAMKNFLRGTIGKLLQIILVILGFSFLVYGFDSCASSSRVSMWLFLVLSILCFSAAGGIRYWLGHIIRMK